MLVADVDAPGVIATRPDEPHTARKIAVMHLIHTVAYGGVETVVLNWLSKLDRSKFDVHLVCFANPNQTEKPFVAEAGRRGFAVAQIPWSRRKPLVKSARALARIMRDQKVDILHTHNEYADFVGAIASRLFPVKSMTTVYVRSDFGWKRNAIQKIDSLTLRLFDEVTAHCEFTRRKISQELPGRKVKTLICGFETHYREIPPEERRRLRSEMGVSDDQVMLVNVARLYPEKAQAFLLRCFAGILRRCPNARLFIVGVGPLEAELKALCTELRLDHAVKFLGWVEEWVPLLPLVDIQVHPAEMEGVSLAVGEGMAAGLPLVASDVGGLSEVLNNGQSGILVPRDDERAFVDAVVRLINDPAERLRLGSAARHFMTHDYSLATAIASLEKTYAEVMNRCD